ncbi:MAG: hypothetical protein R3291_03880, partial [Thermoplasmata archaeon]|nr:hypothetical protein [Thermoplasmata archaeon]
RCLPGGPRPGPTLRRATPAHCRDGTRYRLPGARRHPPYSRPPVRPLTEEERQQVDEIIAPLLG